jgi:hypothetical protein
MWKSLAGCWIGAIITALLFNVGKHLFSLYLGRSCVLCFRAAGYYHVTVGLLFCTDSVLGQVHPGLLQQVWFVFRAKSGAEK